MEQKNHNAYNLFIHMARNVTSSLNDEKILDLIIKEMIDVINAADTGLLYLYDEKKDRLMLKSVIGPRMKYFTELKPGEGVSGAVFFTGEAQIINDENKVKEAILKLYGEISVKDFPNSIISVPLRAKDKFIGALTLDSFHSERKFNENDLELLQAAADHVSIVITQAQLIQREKVYVKQLEKVNMELKKKHALQEKMLTIHNKLTEIVLFEKGLDEIINFLSGIIAHPVKVYDLFLNTIVTSQKAVDKELPSGITKDKAYKNMIKARKPQEIYLPEKKETLFLYPIYGARSILGFIAVWVHQGFKLQQISRMALDYSSTVFALEWLKQEAVNETSQKMRGEFLQNILSGHLDSDLLTQASQLGFKSQEYYGVILFKKNEEIAMDLIEASLRNDNIINRIYNILDRLKLKGIVIPEMNLIYVLISNAQYKKEMLDKKVKILTEKINEIFQLQVGIGRMYEGIENCRKSYFEAKLCLKYIKDFSFNKTILNYSELGVLQFVLTKSKEEINSYINETLSPIIDYDKQKDSDLLPTLLEYINSNKALHSLAKKMNVHYNTVYARVKKTEELLGVRFNDAKDWFNIQAACKIYELTKKS